MNLVEAIEHLKAARGGQPPGVVVTCSPAGGRHVRAHEGVVWAALGRRLAALLGSDFAGEYDPLRRPSARAYFVPSDTLLSSEAAVLGVRSEEDLFGGVVPHPVVATKTITHPLVEPSALAPAGWSHHFPRRVSGVVLPGFSAFALADARCAGARLLGLGPVRLKPARGCGWRRQVVIATPAELEAALAADPEELERDGLVLEQNLTDVTTYSVGQVRVAGLRVTYHGTQRATIDNAGATAYGGSDLLVVRGDYDDLLGLDLTPEVRLAVTQARAYDTAATQDFPGLLASRRNYDVIRGLDAQGRWRSGVLEQSWRIGGASGPEIAALEAFGTGPTLRTVRAWCIEAYGRHEVPPGSIVHFCGVDDHIGPITKYTCVEAHDRSR